MGMNRRHSFFFIRVAYLEQIHETKVDVRELKYQQKG